MQLATYYGKKESCRRALAFIGPYISILDVAKIMITLPPRGAKMYCCAAWVSFLLEIIIRLCLVDDEAFAWGRLERTRDQTCSVLYSCALINT